MYVMLVYLGRYDGDEDFHNPGLRGEERVRVKVLDFVEK